LDCELKGVNMKKLKLNIKKIKEIMEKEGINQSDLAKILGVTRSNVSLMLRKDDKSRNFATVDKLAEALGVTQCDIMMLR